MQFPVYFHLFGMQIHPHPVMEGLAYAAGLTLHLAIKARLKTLGTAERLERSLWQIAGAILGALLGAKILAWIENWHQLTAPASSLAPPGLEKWLGGKTVVGGLLGGWIGVEIAKHYTGIKQRTGDLWVYPLAFSIAIGRVGCFLTGLSDQTYGNFTRLPWAVDFGDGPRHPTQLYEIAALLLIAAALFIYQRTTHLGFATGRLFRLFMLAYCLWRFAVEFIKPTAKPWLGLSAIQWACLLTSAVCVVSLARARRLPKPDILAT